MNNHSDKSNSETVNESLARAIDDLPRELQPRRDLWQGIERRLADHPQRQWRNWWQWRGWGARSGWGRQRERQEPQEMRERQDHLAPPENSERQEKRNWEVRQASQVRREPGNWMPVALAASLVLAATSLLFNFLPGLGQVGGARDQTLPWALEQMQLDYQLVHGPISSQFTRMNRLLPDETLNDLHWNFQLLEEAREGLESAIRKDPDNRRLLAMLMKLQEQELDLMKEVFYEHDNQAKHDCKPTLETEPINGKTGVGMEGTDAQSLDGFEAMGGGRVF